MARRSDASLVTEAGMEAMIEKLAGRDAHFVCAIIGKLDTNQANDSTVAFMLDGEREKMDPNDLLDCLLNVTQATAARAGREVRVVDMDDIHPELN